MKNQDADQMIRDFVLSRKESLAIFIDAPLSLPAVYNHSESASDFFYRKADKEMKAMSPMFLGGLTARAMKLKYELQSEMIQFYEAYPAAAVNFLSDKTGYKKDNSRLSHFMHQLLAMLESEADFVPASWHEFDATLAYYIGVKYASGIAFVAGSPDEGLIYY